MSVFDEKALVQAIMARLARIDVGYGYSVTIGSANVWEQRQKFDPKLDTLPAITVIYLGGDFDPMGVAPRYYEQLSTVHIVGIIAAGQEDKYPPLDFLRDIKQAAMTPLEGENLPMNAIIPLNTRVFLAQPGDNFTEVHFTLRPQWCDDTVSQDY